MNYFSVLKMSVTRARQAFVSFRRIQTALAMSSGPILCLSFSLSNIYEEDPRARRMLGIVAWVASWWVTEIIPLAATALLPFILMPLLGILSSNKSAQSYLNDAAFLFLGNFLLAQAVEKWNLHRRIALKILSIVGTQPKLLLGGFIVSAAFLSMWISNTATSVMMIPMAIGVLDTLRNTSNVHNEDDDESNDGVMDDKDEAEDMEDRLLGEAESHNGSAPEMSSFEVEQHDDAIYIDDSGENDIETKKKETASNEYGRGLVLGIAYACSIGGLATITGTGPNIILSGYWNKCHNTKGVVQANFSTWILLGFPLVVCFIGILWVLMTYLFARKLKMSGLNTDAIRKEIQQLPPMSWPEKVILIDFGVTILLWLTRQTEVGGWGDLFPPKTAPKDGTVSVTSALVLFLIPSFDPSRKMKRILDWKTAVGLPWDIVLVLGGGFAMSAGIQQSGLLDWLALHLTILNEMPLVLVPTFVATFVTAITEFTSNVATSTIILPLLDGIAESANIPFQLVLLPATLACSLAFMLPNATPPNAVAYSSGYLTVPQMMRPGFFLNVIGVGIITFFCLTLAPAVFNFKIEHVYEVQSSCTR